MKVPGLRLEADPSSLPWRETRVDGVAWIPLHQDEPTEGPRRPGATVLIRMRAGCGYTPHRHVDGEDVLVLAGGYRDEAGTYTRGEHVHYPAGSAHAPVALEGEDCILYATAPGGIELLETPTAPNLET